MTKLTDKIQKSFNLAGYSEKTQQAYFSSIIDCKKYFQKPLIKLTKDDLENYFSNLVESRKSQTVIKHRYYALLFLFKKVFETDFLLSDMPGGKTKKNFL